MNQSLKIVFFGNEHLATGVKSNPLLFQALLKSRHTLLALVVHSSEKTSRGQKKEPIIELAEANNIPVHNPQKAIDCLELLKDYGADCGVLVAYGKIVPEEVIAMFPRGILNLHPSLLPKLRGSTPLETAILTGVQETGVSVMKLIKAMDAGVVYTQIPMHINSSITKQELSDTLHKAGADAVLDVLNDLDTFTDSDKEQVEAEATFSARISKSDGNIDWNESATDIERKIRAYAGWPKSYCTLAGARYILHSAEIAQGHIAEKPGDYIVTESTLGIQTSDGSLYITSLQPEGKKVMPIKAFLAGYRNKLS